MTDNPIERAARAAADYNSETQHGQFGWDSLTEEGRDFFRQQTLAAFRAVRDLPAGHPVLMAGQCTTGHWQAMIDTPHSGGGVMLIGETAIGARMTAPLNGVAGERLEIGDVVYLTPNPFRRWWQVWKPKTVAMKIIGQSSMPDNHPD